MMKHNRVEIIMLSIYYEASELYAAQLRA